MRSVHGPTCSDRFQTVTISNRHEICNCSSVSDQYSMERRTVLHSMDRWIEDHRDGYFSSLVILVIKASSQFTSDIDPKEICDSPKEL